MDRTGYTGVVGTHQHLGVFADLGGVHSLGVKLGDERLQIVMDVGVILTGGDDAVGARDLPEGVDFVVVVENPAGASIAPTPSHSSGS